MPVGIGIELTNRLGNISSLHSGGRQGEDGPDHRQWCVFVFVVSLASQPKCYFSSRSHTTA